MNINKRVELLAPAGSLKKAKYAFKYGADAIYIGIPMYSLRGKENKFTLDEVKEIIKYAHSINKKVYVTTNIYFHNFKIPNFINHLKKILEIKPDAFIVSDPGIIDLIKETCTKCEIHLSVQANATNYLSVKFWKKNGISRVILPRELTLKEIEEIKNKNKDMELEVFVHGSICIAYSGRCLLSNYFNYRDANQGICNNACRWKYKIYKNKEAMKESDEIPILDKEIIKHLVENKESMKYKNYKEVEGRYFLEENLRKGELIEIEENSNGTYLLNSKDLCAIEYLEDLIKIGIDSFKIEGRNKSEYYLSIVTKTYRKAIDFIYKGKKLDFKCLFEELNTISNREYIPGFLGGNLRGFSENYKNSSTYKSHKFISLINNVEKVNNKWRLELDLKNKINKGDKIEIISPDVEEVRKIKINKILILDKDTTNNFLEVDKFSPGSNKKVYIEIPFEIDKFSILRKKI